MSKICAAIDTQGFSANYQFYPREIAVVSDKLSTCVQVRTGLKLEELTYENARTCLYQQHRVNGLSLDSIENNLVSIYGDNTEKVIETFYKQSCSAEKDTFICKHPQLQQILAKLNIPFVESAAPKDTNSWCCHFHSKDGFKCALRKATHIWHWSSYKSGANKNVRIPINNPRLLDYW